MKIEEDSPQVRIWPPLLYVGALIVSLAIESRIGLLPPRAGGLGLAAEIRWSFGTLLVIVGLLFMARAAGLFLRLGTRVPPWRPATRLVTSGPFRWSRNPMYLGMTVTYVGIGVACDSIMAMLLLVALVLPVMQTQVIAKEERYLERKFGIEYLSYKQRVRRWI